MIGARHVTPRPPEPDRPREDEFRRRVRAYESVKEDWTDHHDDRPEDLREEVWYDPPADVPHDVTEAEKRFIDTRRIRRRVLEWRGDLQ